MVGLVRVVGDVGLVGFVGQPYQTYTTYTTYNYLKEHIRYRYGRNGADEVSEQTASHGMARELNVDRAEIDR